MNIYFMQTYLTRLTSLELMVYLWYRVGFHAFRCSDDAAPRTTIDLSIQTGESISIEERSSLEACTVRGKVISEGSLQENVADDGQYCIPLLSRFNDANLIDAISTEVGVIVKDSGNNQFDLRTYFK
ncbi:hypothetical protein MJO29_010292 [Puccinia striiformis f. sp. tritici]|nr:hypothetical protein MJO29_010292 [Puccinia striiformis f. sp. tritici]